MPIDKGLLALVITRLIKAGKPVTKKGLVQEYVNSMGKYRRLGPNKLHREVLHKTKEGPDAVADIPFRDLNPTQKKLRLEGIRSMRRMLRSDVSKTSRNSDHHFVTASDVHVDSALHIPKRNKKRLRRTTAKGYNAPMTITKNQKFAKRGIWEGPQMPADYLERSAPQRAATRAKIKKERRKSLAIVGGTIATAGGLALALKRRKRLKKHADFLSEQRPSKVSTPMTLPNQGHMRSSNPTRGFAQVEHIEGFEQDHEFAVGALAKAGQSIAGLIKKRKQLPQATQTAKQTVQNKLNRNPAARLARRKIKKNPLKAAGVAAGAGLGAGYLLSGDQDFQGSGMGSGLNTQRRSTGMRSASMARTGASRSAMSGMKNNFAGDRFLALKKAASGIKQRTGTSYKKARKRGGRALLATGAVGGTAGVGAGVYGYKRVAN